VVAGAVAVVVVDGLVDGEQLTSAIMIATAKSAVARRTVRMLATADRSTVASRRLWLKVFTSRRLREIICDPGRVGLQRVFRIGACDINGEEVQVLVDRAPLLAETIRVNSYARDPTGAGGATGAAGEVSALLRSPQVAQLQRNASRRCRARFHLSAASCAER
jgi:hypothetical protein